MADNEKMIAVKTSLIALTKWAKEKKDNKRIDLGYFNDMLYFSIMKPNNEGKFKDTKSVYLKNINDITMYLIAKEIIERLEKLHNGEEITSQELIIHNNKSTKDATTIVAFNAYKKDDRNIIYIAIKKKKKEGEGYEIDEKFYFGGSHNLSRYGDRKVTDTETYGFFKQMELLFKSAAGRYSDSRSKHLERYLNATNPSASGNSKSSSSSNKSYSKDEDDYPF